METIKVKFIHDQQLAKPKFKGFFGGLKTILQTEGFRVSNHFFLIRFVMYHCPLLQYNLRNSHIGKITRILQGLYQGVTATMAKQGSNQAIRFFVMETLKDW